MIFLFIKCLLSIFIALIGIFTLCGWLHPLSYKNLIWTTLKMLYQAFIEPVLILLLLWQLAFSVILMALPDTTLIHSSFYKTIYVIVWGYILIGFIYCDLIKYAPLKRNTDHYLPHIDALKKSFKCDLQDFTSLYKSVQFNVYHSIDGINKETCLLYLNYNNWYTSNQTKSSRYLRQLALKRGYSFAIYSGIDQTTGTLVDMVQDIKNAIAILKEHSYKHIILIGGDSGGHLALITALSSAYPKIYGENSSDVDGVIALYPTLTASFKYSNIKNMTAASDIPIFIIHGTHDGVVSSSLTREVYDSFSLNNKTISYLELPNVDHNFDSFQTPYHITLHKVKKEIAEWLYIYFNQ